MRKEHNAGSEPVGRLVGRPPRPQTEVGQLHLPKIRAREEEEGETSCPGKWSEATELLCFLNQRTRILFRM